MKTILSDIILKMCVLFRIELYSVLWFSLSLWVTNSHFLFIGSLGFPSTFHKFIPTLSTRTVTLSLCSSITLPPSFIFSFGDIPVGWTIHQVYWYPSLWNFSSQLFWNESLLPTTLWWFVHLQAVLNQALEDTGEELRMSQTWHHVSFTTPGIWVSWPWS